MTKTIPVAVVRHLPLTTKLIYKMEIANENVASFTVFVNRKHSLAHVLRKGDDCYMRVPIPSTKGLKYEADHTLSIYFGIRIRQWMLNF